METLRHFHRFEKENTVAMVILLSVKLMEWLLHGNQASPAVKHAHGPAVQLFCEVYDFVLCSKRNETKKKEKRKIRTDINSLRMTVSLDKWKSKGIFSDCP